MKCPNFKLIIVGDGPERKSLEALAKKQKISNKIIFTGERKDTERFYNLADIYVHSAKQEGFPNVFLEAMSSGVPNF